MVLRRVPGVSGLTRAQGDGQPNDAWLSQTADAA